MLFRCQSRHVLQAGESRPRRQRHKSVFGFRASLGIKTKSQAALFTVARSQTIRGEIA
jgi:hypothetical protein